MAQIESGLYNFRCKVIKSNGELEILYKSRLVLNDIVLKSVVKSIKEDLEGPNIVDIEITHKLVHGYSYLFS